MMLGVVSGLSSLQEYRPQASLGCTGDCNRFSSLVACPGHDITCDSKQIHRGQTKKDTDSGVKGNRGRLSKQLFQHCNGKVCIIIVVDRISREPHIIGGEMWAAYYCGQEALIHKHFKVLYIRPIGSNPTQQKNHAQEDRFTYYNVEEMSTYKRHKTSSNSYKTKDAAGK